MIPAMTPAATTAARDRNFRSSLASMPPAPALPFEKSPRALIEGLAHGDIALLLRRPVAAAGNGAIDHQIVAIDEAGLVAGEKHRGMGDIFRQPGARDRLRGLVDLARQVGGFLR